MRTHEYLPDASAIDRPEGEPRCQCGMPRKNRVHEEKDRTDQRELQDRILGE